jgi:hypothetical protein
VRFRRFKPRSFAHRPAFALAILSLMVTALATFGSGIASAQPAHPARPDIAAQKAAPASGQTIRFRVVNVTGQELKVTKNDVTAGHWRAGQAPKVGDPVYNTETTDSILESEGGAATAYVTYQIGNAAYSVTVSGGNVAAFPNSGDCKVTSGAPYKCELHVGSGNDNNLDAVVEPTTAATHTLTEYTNPSRRDAADGLCANPPLPAKVTCTPNTLDNVDATLGPARPASSVLVNCGSATNSINVKAATTVTQTNTIGVSSDVVNKSLITGWEPKLSGSYQHSWTESRLKEESTTLNVPSGYYGWIDMRPILIAVTGDYTLKAGNQTYLIGSFTISQPASAAWLAKNPEWANREASYAVDYPMDKAAVCGGGTAPFTRPQPTPPQAGGTYTITVAGANQWAVTVPGRSHEPGKVMEMDNVANAIGRNQQWTFLPIPGQPATDWQLSTANTPPFCLTTDSSSVVFQTTCAAPTNYDLGTQVWRLAYDPALGGYQILQAFNQESLSIREDRPYTGLRVWAARGTPIPSRSRWVLTSKG